MEQASKRGRPHTQRRRRRGSQIRAEALAAARVLLRQGGPAAVTVAKVGARIGISHSTMLHHFGSAVEFQSALTGSMVHDLTAALADLTEKLGADAGPPHSIAERVFDAFDRGGTGSLAAWIVLAGNDEQLDPIRNAVGSLVAAIVAQTGDAHAEERVRRMVLMVTICAFGEAVIGRYLRGKLGQPRDAMRSVR